jgi:hypothetical protein
MVLTTLWVLLGILPDTLCFYIWCILTTILGGTFISCWNYKYENIMRLNKYNLKKMFKHVDFYLEEMITLMENYDKSELYKFKLIEVVTDH